MNRRKLLAGLGLSLMAPAIVRADCLMRLPVVKKSDFWPYRWQSLPNQEGFQLVGFGDGVVYRMETYENPPLLSMFQIKENILDWQDPNCFVNCETLWTGQRWVDLAQGAIKSIAEIAP